MCWELVKLCDKCITLYLNSLSNLVYAWNVSKERKKKKEGNKEGREREKEKSERRREGEREGRKRKRGRNLSKDITCLSLHLLYWYPNCFLFHQSFPFVTKCYLVLVVNFIQDGLGRLPLCTFHLLPWLYLLMALSIYMWDVCSAMFSLYNWRW